MIHLKKEDCYCDIVEFYENIAKKLGIEAIQFNCSKIRVTKPVQQAIWDYYKEDVGANDVEIAMLWVDMGPEADLEGDDYRAETEEGFAIRSSKFGLGRVVMTPGVSDKIKNDSAFQQFVDTSLGQFVNGDWGILCDEDKEVSDRAVANNQQIMGAYKHGDTEIWIITEADRSVTTILFPSEY